MCAQWVTDRCDADAGRCKYDTCSTTLLQLASSGEAGVAVRATAAGSCALCTAGASEGGTRVPSCCQTPYGPWNSAEAGQQGPVWQPCGRPG